MATLLLTIFYALIIFACQVFNNSTTFTNALIIPIGLFVYTPAHSLRPIQATIFYCIIGTIFDSLFQFLPFGFTVIFFLSSYAFVKSVSTAHQQIGNIERASFEQLANIIYIVFMFSFSQASFVIHQLLSTIIFSQIFLLLSSKATLSTCKKLETICDNYVKYE